MVHGLIDLNLPGGVSQGQYSSHEMTEHDSRGMKLTLHEISTPTPFPLPQHLSRPLLNYTLNAAVASHAAPHVSPNNGQLINDNSPHAHAQMDTNLGVRIGTIILRG